MVRCLVRSFLLVHFLVCVCLAVTIKDRFTRADYDDEDFDDEDIEFNDEIDSDEEGDENEGTRDKRRARVEKTTTTYFYTLHADTEQTWEEANRRCKEKDGVVVAISDNKTRDFLAEWIPTQASEGLFYLQMEKRVDDGKKKEKEKEWQYYNRTKVTYVNWADDEPDLSKRCAVISSDHGYEWITHSCDGGAGYICQFDCKRDPFWCVRGTVTHTEDTCSCTCEERWTGPHCDELQESVYNYDIPIGKGSFSNAKSYCDNLHTTQPSVLDEKPIREFRALVDQKSFLRETTVYVDLTLQDGAWVDSNGQTSDNLNWMPNEPREGNECAVASTGNNNRLKSVDCSETHKYMCELPCRKAREKWCVHGDVIVNSRGSCSCDCWPGSFGAFCEEYDYDDAIAKTLKFYETQQSGMLPPYNRIPWRSDSALEDMGYYGEDLTGGWYDAGDYIKVTYKHTASVWKLALAFLEFEEAYEAAGEVKNFLNTLKWGNLYTMKLHTRTLGHNQFYAHVSDPKIDHKYWGRPEDFQQHGINRPAYPVNETHPGTDVAANGAASLAASAMVFKDREPDFAEKMLLEAKEWYEFADKFRGTFGESIPELHFQSGPYHDELTNAGLWMYLATGEEHYLEKTIRHYDEYKLKKPDHLFSRNRVSLPLQLIMYLTTRDTKYLEPVEKALDRWWPGADQVKYSPWGMAVITNMRPIKRSADTAFICLIAAKYGIHREKYLKFAREQMHYILGDSGRSYLTGFGRRPPVRAHHRASSCPLRPFPCGREQRDSPDPNPQILYGGLVGGPDDRDNFFDHRRNYMQTEAGINVAGFQGALAGLSYFRLQEKGWK